MCAEMHEQRPDNRAEQYLAIRVIAFSREECPFDKAREHMAGVAFIQESGTPLPSLRPWSGYANQ